MAAGFKIYNSNGSLQMDTSSRTFRMLMSTSVNGSGSANVLGYSGNIQAVVETAGLQPPTVTVNQSTGQVSWTYPAGDTSRGVLKVFEY